jgi:tetratricopeptide (TPR) repeat protein
VTVGLQKEHGLLLATVAVVGLMVAFGGDAERRRPLVRAKDKAYQPIPAGRDLFTATQAPADRARDLFRQPTEDSPLPPKALAAPELPAGPVLAPPVPPAPGVARLHLLRQDAAQTTEHAFVEGAEGAAGAAPENGSPEAALNAGAAGGAGAANPRPGARAAGSPTSPQAGTTAEQAKLKYDWVNRHGSLTWGRIHNPDKFDLPRPVPDEPIRFQTYSLRTDRPVSGVDWIEIKPEEISDFGFAATLRNFIEIEKRKITLSPADLEKREQFVLRLLAEAKTNPFTYEVAEQQAKLYRKVEPGSARGYELLARVYREAGRLEDELALYRELSQSDHNLKDAPFVWRGLGLLEAKLGLYQDAEDHLRDAVRLGAKDGRDSAALAKFLVERGRPDDAWEHALAAQRNAPAEGPALFEIRATWFVAALARGDLKEAADALGKAKAAAGEDQPGRIAHLEGALAYAAGDFPGAEAAFGRATAGESLSGAAHIGLGAARTLLAKFGEARSSLDFAAELDPLLRHLALTAQAFLMERTRNQSEALARAEAAFLVDPTDVYVLYQLGRQRRRNQQFADAEQALQGALAQRHDFVEALGEMALVHLARVDAAEVDPLAGLDAAARYARKAMELDATRGRNVFYPELLGFVAFRRGDLEEANRAFREASERGASPFAKTFIALIEYRQNRVADALGTLQGLLEDPGYPPDYRAYALRTVQDIEFHRSKRVMTDRFDTKRNWWEERVQGTSVSADARDGRLKFSNKMGRSDKPYAWRYDQRDANNTFLSAEVTLTPGDRHQARWAGLEISDETERGAQVTSGFRARIGIYRGGIYCQIVEGAQAAGGDKGREPVSLDLPAPAGQPVRLRIEVRRGGERQQDIMLVFTANRNAAPPVRATRFGGIRTLHVDLFAEGATSDFVDVTFKDFELTRREQ